VPPESNPLSGGTFLFFNHPFVHSQIFKTSPYLSAAFPTESRAWSDFHSAGRTSFFLRLTQAITAFLAKFGPFVKIGVKIPIING